MLALDDPVDLLAAIAGLQLMPENADRGVRLDVLAHVCVARQPRRRKLPVSRSRLRRICDAPVLQLLRKLEDPFPNPFTENMTFFGGGFIVFPGRFDETTFVLRHLCMVLFQPSVPFPDTQFVTDARGLIAVVLAISDAMADSAGLERGITPPERKAGSIVVPSTERLQRLKRAVRFRRSDLTDLLVANGASPDILNDLITPIGQVSLQHYHPDHGELFARPLVSVGDHVIVALPGQLLAAVRHAIVRRARARGLIDEFAYRYACAIAFTIHESLAVLGHHPIALRPDPIPDIPILGVGFHSLDTDKLLYVMVLTDPLQTYQEDAAYATWDLRENALIIEEHLRRIAATVREEIDPVVEIFCLLLVQGVGHFPLFSQLSG